MDNELGASVEADKAMTTDKKAEESRRKPKKAERRWWKNLLHSNM